MPVPGVRQSGCSGRGLRQAGSETAGPDPLPPIAPASPRQPRGRVSGRTSALLGRPGPRPSGREPDTLANRKKARPAVRTRRRSRGRSARSAAREDVRERSGVEEEFADRTAREQHAERVSRWPEARRVEARPQIGMCPPLARTIVFGESDERIRRPGCARLTRQPARSRPKATANSGSEGCPRSRHRGRAGTPSRSGGSPPYSAGRRPSGAGRARLPTLPPRTARGSVRAGSRRSASGRGSVARHRLNDAGRGRAEGKAATRAG
jgi:hypothetical protein